MSWEDRDYARDGGGFGRPGGDWRGIRPSLDNPFSWSVSIGRYFGINVRIHVILLLFIVVQLFRASIGDNTPIDLYYTSIVLLSLFLLILLHEFGHCAACRSTGGVADEILMWPLGGLAYCRPPDRWTAHLWTVIGGPLVNFVFAVIFALILGFTVGVWWGVAIPNPMGLPRDGPWWDHAAEWQRILSLVAWINMILLLFNVLLPLFPMDGGRIVQALLWAKLGYVRSMRIAVRVGYIGAIVLALFTIIFADTLGASNAILLFSIALFGGFTCWSTYKQLQYTEEVMGFSHDEYALGIGRENDEDRPKAPSKRAQLRARKRAETERRASEELDRLLEKIKTEGMGSLSGRERRWLQTQTKKRRSGT